MILSVDEFSLSVFCSLFVFNTVHYYALLHHLNRVKRYRFSSYHINIGIAVNSFYFLTLSESMHELCKKERDLNIFGSVRRFAFARLFVQFNIKFFFLIDMNSLRIITDDQLCRI